MSRLTGLGGWLLSCWPLALRSTAERYAIEAIRVCNASSRDRADLAAARRALEQAEADKLSLAGELDRMSAAMEQVLDELDQARRSRDRALERADRAERGRRSPIQVRPHASDREVS